MLMKPQLNLDSLHFKLKNLAAGESIFILIWAWKVVRYFMLNLIALKESHKSAEWVR